MRSVIASMSRLSARELAVALGSARKPPWLQTSAGVVSSGSSDSAAGAECCCCSVPSPPPLPPPLPPPSPAAAAASPATEAEAVATCTGWRLKSVRSSASSCAAASRCASRRLVPSLLPPWVGRRVVFCACGELKRASATRAESTRILEPPRCCSSRCQSGRRSSMCGGSSVSIDDASSRSGSHSCGVLGQAAATSHTSINWSPPILMLRPQLSSTRSAALEPTARPRKLPTPSEPSCHTSTAAPGKSGDTAGGGGEGAAESSIDRHAAAGVHCVLGGSGATHGARKKAAELTASRVSGIVIVAARSCACACL